MKFKEIALCQITNYYLEIIVQGANNEFFRMA